MEKFAVDHSGIISVRHELVLECSNSVISIAKEIRYIALIVVCGWAFVASMKTLKIGNRKDN